MITVVSTALNAQEYAPRCILSVRRQIYKPRAHVYIDAASDDLTVQAARMAAGPDDPGATQGRTIILAHDVRKPLLENIHPVIARLPADEIVVWLDGDDWLATDYALARVAAAYEDPDCWLTFGSYITSHGRMGFAHPYPSEAWTMNEFRHYPWYATHLKTFRAGLFQHVPVTYHQENDGTWFKLAVDQAIMFPMLDMAGPRHRFIPEILAVYNQEHSFEHNAHEVGHREEFDTALRIRGREPIEPLTAAPW